jgi:hypothetical protein
MHACSELTGERWWEVAGAAYLADYRLGCAELNEKSIYEHR